MRRHSAALALFLSLLCAGTASAFDVGARGAYWITTFSGEVQLDSDGVQGTLIDAQDDLGIEDEDFVFGEVWLWAGDHHLTLAGMKVDYSGDETLSEPIVFGGVIFRAGVQAESSLEYLMLDLTYQYDLIDLENVLAGFSLGPIVQVKYLDGEVKMEGWTARPCGGRSRLGKRAACICWRPPCLGREWCCAQWRWTPKRTRLARRPRY